MKCLRKIFNNPTNTLMKDMKVNLKQLMGLMLVMLLALQCSSEGFSSGTSSGRRLRVPNMRRKTTQGGVSGFGVRSSQTDDFSSNASQTSKKSTIKSTGGSSLLPESFDVEQDDVKQSKSTPQKVLTRLSTFASTANFFRGVTPRDGVVCLESSRIAFRNAV